MSAKRPDQPHISASIDLATELKSQNVLLGFTSATGAAGNTHDVLHWHFRSGQRKPVDQLGRLIVSENAQSTTTTSPKTLMIVMDASGSMNGRIDNVPKLDIAKTVLLKTIAAIRSQMAVGLRVYGHRYPKAPKARSCRDTKRLFYPTLNKEWRFITRETDRLKAQGQTPIGYTLAQLPEDLKWIKRGRKWSEDTGEKQVLLISDGIETCDLDPGDEYSPPDVAKALRASGIDVRNVVGFDLKDEAASNCSKPSQKRAEVDASYLGLSLYISR